MLNTQVLLGSASGGTIVKTVLSGVTVKLPLNIKLWISHFGLLIPVTRWAKKIVTVSGDNGPCYQSGDRIIVTWEGKKGLIRDSGCSVLCYVLKPISHVQLFATSWTAACQGPLSKGFSRQYWNGLPYLSPGYLPDPGIKPKSLTSPALAAEFLTISTTWEAPGCRGVPKI